MHSEVDRRLDLLCQEKGIMREKILLKNTCDSLSAKLVQRLSDLHQNKFEEISSEIFEMKENDVITPMTDDTETIMANKENKNINNWEGEKSSGKKSIHKIMKKSSKIIIKGQSMKEEAGWSIPPEIKSRLLQQNPQSSQKEKKQEIRNHGIPKKRKEESVDSADSEKELLDLRNCMLSLTLSTHDGLMRSLSAHMEAEISSSQPTTQTKQKKVLEKKEMKHSYRKSTKYEIKRRKNTRKEEIKTTDSENDNEILNRLEEEVGCKGIVECNIKEVAGFIIGFREHGEAFYNELLSHMCVEYEHMLQSSINPNYTHNTRDHDHPRIVHGEEENNHDHEQHSHARDYGCGPSQMESVFTVNEEGAHNGVETHDFIQIYNENHQFSVAYLTPIQINALLNAILIHAYDPFITDLKHFITTITFFLQCKDIHLTNKQIYQFLSFFH